MIPKIFHYCWFGPNEKGKLAERCMRSWKKYCQDYQFIEWNETNFDIASAPRYVREAYEHKKWAFIGDYVRLKAIYEQGGVYFDLDAELVKDIDDLLNNESFFCSENGTFVSPGLGFGAVPHNECVKLMMDDYAEIPFYYPEENRFDLTPSPVRHTKALQPILGMIDRFDKKIDIKGNLFLPRDYFCPMDYSTQALMFKSSNTRAIHWFAASWYDEQRLKELKQLRQRCFFHRLIINTFGMEFFKKLKNTILILSGRKAK